MLGILAAANLAYQVAQKPTELLFPLSGTLDKPPAETWRAYAPQFRRYATAAIPSDLLAALAQAESSGNPLARTYWRWRLSWNPLAIYQPASSAVGTYQMTGAAFAEARRYCIRHHAVVAAGCGLSGLYMRIIPSHAIELAAIYLDRNVTAILDRLPKSAASPRQIQELATVVHLCGPSVAAGFAHRGFLPARGQRCGDHDLAIYLAKVGTLQREFHRLAGES